MDDNLSEQKSDIDECNKQFHNLLAQDMDKALVQCQAIRKQSETMGYQKGVLDADFNRGWYHLWRCEFSRAFPLLRGLPELYKALNDDFGYLKSLNCLGVIHLDMGNYDSALPYFMASLEIAREKNEKEREASVLANLGLLYEGLERIEEAYDYFSVALNIKELNDTGFYTASKCVALYFIKKKKWSDAAGYLNKAIDKAIEKNDLHFVSELLVTLGTLYKKQNRNRDAEAAFRQGLEISKPLGNVKIETEHLYELGALYLTECDYDKALSYFHRVMDKAEDKSIGSLICKSYEALSQVHESLGDHRLALEYLKKFIGAEKEYHLRKAELKLQSMQFEHELEKQQQQAETYKLRSIELEKANQEILEQVNQDSLTGLPNRRLFMQRLKSAVARAETEGSKLALLFVDLDNFKPVNDRYGHLAGDRLLKEVANRLTGVLRKQDIVARFGGDEFVILVPELEGYPDVRAAGERIVEVMRQSFPVGEDTYQLSSSVGVSVYPEHGDNAEALLSCADQAMYAAKIKGKDTFVLYESV